MSLTDKFDRNRRRQTGNIEPTSIDEVGEIENYAKHGTIRNLSFVLLDGTRQFFNYADLTSCNYLPTENKIILNYRGFYSVTLVGRNLDLLYTRLLDQVPRQIKCLEKHYELTKSDHEMFVTNIIIVNLAI